MEKYLQFKRVVETVGEVTTEKLLYLGSSNVRLQETTDLKENILQEELEILQNGGHINIVDGEEVYVLE